MQIDLRHGDCIDVMKTLSDKSVDMVLTDPPYGMNFQSNGRKVKHDKIANDTNLDWLDSFTDEIHRVLKDNTASYVFCSFHNIDKFKLSLQRKFIIKNLLVWEKHNATMGDLDGDFAPKVEYIFLILKGKKSINGHRDPNIFKFKSTGNKHHPTQKPIELCGYLISKFSAIGDTVLDPFMGSGSTGVGCLKMRRSFIGIELSEKYVQTARYRMRKGAIATV